MDGAVSPSPVSAPSPLTAIARPATRRVGPVEERAGWVDRSGRRSFVFLHLPPRPVAGLVVCSPIGGEADTNRRREVLLARTLAAGGVAVLRHDYLGTGNSDGSPVDLTFQSMVDDARFAVELLAEQVGRAPAVLGTRLGASVAAAAATATTTSGVALWHPARDGRSYFREVGMLRKLSKLTQQTGQVADELPSVADAMAATGHIELAGYELHRNLYESVMALRLGDVDLPAASAALVVEFDTDQVSRWLQDLVDRWRQGGVDCRAEAVAERENWWFANDMVAEEERTLTRRVIEVTADWIAARSGDTQETNI